MEIILISTITEIKKSTKSIGAYEEPIISRLCNHFESLGFRAFPHVRLNVAWGSSLSDIDTLLIQDNIVVAIEVKSSHDKLAKAQRQLESLSDYVDYSYVATDKLPRNWKSRKTGLLFVSQDGVNIVRRATQLTNKPKLDSFTSLPKKCLLRFSVEERHERLLKHDIARKIRQRYQNGPIKECLKEIALCQNCSDTTCPIMHMTHPVSF